jgi:hypothetical protein
MGQPDSEPNMPSRPTQIHAGISDDLGEQPIQAAPHEVLLPSDDDDFVVGDVWMCQGDKLLRIHN